MIFDYETKKTLEEAWLIEMAMPRKDVTQYLEANAFTFKIHLAKCFLFRNTQWYNHWLTELSNYCLRCDDIWLKPNRTRPDKQFIKNTLLEEIEEASDAKNYLNFAIDRCPEIDKDEATNDECFIFIDLWEDLREELADYLSDKDTFDRSTYKEIIDNAIKRYPIN